MIIFLLEELRFLQGVVGSRTLVGGCGGVLAWLVEQAQLVSPNYYFSFLSDCLELSLVVIHPISVSSLKWK